MIKINKKEDKIMKVLGIGETIIDNVYRTDELVESILGSDVKIKKVLKQIHNDYIQSEMHIGGPVPAALIVLSRLGIDCTMVTSVGHDEHAKIIKKTFKRERIKLLHKLQKKTKVNTILVDNKTGVRKKIRGATIHPDIKNLDRKFVREFDIIIIDRHEKTAFYEIISKKRSDTKIIIDPSIEISNFTLDMIKIADYPIIPIESLVKVDAVSLKDSLKKLYSLTNKHIIITAGDKGSFIYKEGKIELIPAYDIHAVDVTGAGDVFRGAFAYGVISNWDINKCATFANFVAGLQCTKIGNIAAIPMKMEMEVFDIIYQRKQLNIPVINNIFNNFINL